MKLICISIYNKTFGFSYKHVTIGKSYEVEYQTDDCWMIINDVYLECFYPKENFISLQKARILKLKQIDEKRIFMENLEFEIKTLGKLKYSRLKSLSKLKKEINSFDYCYTMSEVKELLDSILNNTLEERFNSKFKYCFDKIFVGMKYIEYDDNPTEQNFPDG